LEYQFAWIYWKYLWPDFPSYRFVHNAIKIMLVILFRLYIQKIDPSFCRCVRIFKAKGDSSTEAPRYYLTISSWVFILLIVLILLIEQCCVASYCRKNTTCTYCFPYIYILLSVCSSIFTTEILDLLIDLLRAKISSFFGSSLIILICFLFLTFSFYVCLIFCIQNKKKKN
jgi:hypothetical protein